MIVKNTYIVKFDGMDAILYECDNGKLFLAYTQRVFFESEFKVAEMPMHQASELYPEIFPAVKS